MKYDSKIYYRKSTRLKGYDYSSPGAYFVTICTYRRECLFGEVVNREMRLNELGGIVESEWLRSFEIRKELQADVYKIMPNHLHGIVFIHESACCVNLSIVGANGCSPQNINDAALRANCHSPLRCDGRFFHQGMRPKSISSFMAGFKSAAKTRINTLRQTPGQPVWQRNYHDHIIRSENELNRIREYVVNNALKWEFDKGNPNYRTK